MDALLNRVTQIARQTEASAWRRYAEILRSETGDAASPGLAEELEAIMRDLRLTPDDVRRHAAALKTVAELEPVAADLDARRQRRDAARLAHAELREKNEQAKKELDRAVREAERAKDMAGHSTEEAADAAQRVRRIRTELAQLFHDDAGNVAAPALDVSAADVPPVVDARLVGLDRGRLYTAAELAELGFDAKAEGFNTVPRFDRDRYAGAVVAEWARQARRVIRSRRRRELEGRLFTIPDALFALPADGAGPGATEKLYTKAELLAAGASEAVLSEFMMATVLTSAQCRSMALRVRAAHDLAAEELAGLAAQDVAEGWPAPDTAQRAAPPPPPTSATTPTAPPQQQSPTTTPTDAKAAPWVAQDKNQWSTAAQETPARRATRGR